MDDKFSTTETVYNPTTEVWTVTTEVVDPVQDIVLITTIHDTEMDEQTHDNIIVMHEWRAEMVQMDRHMNGEYDAMDVDDLAFDHDWDRYSDDEDDDIPF
jgi:hypothetical protein